MTTLKTGPCQLCQDTRKLILEVQTELRNATNLVEIAVRKQAGPPVCERCRCVITGVFTGTGTGVAHVYEEDCKAVRDTNHGSVVHTYSIEDNWPGSMADIDALPRPLRAAFHTLLEQRTDAVEKQFQAERKWREQSL